MDFEEGVFTPLSNVHMYNMLFCFLTLTFSQVHVSQSADTESHVAVANVDQNEQLEDK